MRRFYRRLVTDELTERYGDLLTGSYDCVDRLVLNAYYPMGHSPGGFRTWWRAWRGGDDELDDTHLMRLAGRFSRRVRGWAKANDVPVIDCKSGERKHQIAEEYLATHDVGVGVFMVLVARAPAPVWQVQRNARGVIVNLEKKKAFVNHYSFHIMDPDWGHVTIKMSGHPPFGCQVILNGHEYVSVLASRAGIGLRKEANCFTEVSDSAGLARLADTLSQRATVGRLGQVCDRWIYTACLCFGLDVADQQRSGFSYSYSIYQVEYSRNLLFASGAQMEGLFDTIVDRTRRRLDIPTVRTLFGRKQRPRLTRNADLSPRQAVVIETPRFGLTVFKVHFGRLTLKAYTKGEHVLRLEAVVHNTTALHCGRVLERFPDIVAHLGAMADRCATVLDCVDVAFLANGVLEELRAPSTLGAIRVGGVDVNNPRIRAALGAVSALAVVPDGFTVAALAAKVNQASPHINYTTRQAAYDLRKLRAKRLVEKPGRGRSYHVPPHVARTITAISVLHDQVLTPIIAGVRSPRNGRKPAAWTTVDRDYEVIRIDVQRLFGHLGLATTSLPMAA